MSISVPARTRRLLLACGAIPALIVAIVALYRPWFTNRLENAVYDYMLRWSGTRPSSGRVVIVVSDSGRWKSESTSRDRGRGLGLMRALMESVEIVPSSDGTSVRLERTLSGVASTP